MLNVHSFCCFQRSTLLLSFYKLTPKPHSMCHHTPLRICLSQCCLREVTRTKGCNPRLCTSLYRGTAERRGSEKSWDATLPFHAGHLARSEPRWDQRVCMKRQPSDPSVLSGDVAWPFEAGGARAIAGPLSGEVVQGPLRHKGVWPTDKQHPKVRQSNERQGMVLLAERGCAPAVVRDATTVTIKAAGDLNGYTDLNFVRRVCRIRPGDITSSCLRYFQDAFQAHHKACGSTDYYFIPKAFKRGGMQISSLPPSLSGKFCLDEYGWVCK